MMKQSSSKLKRDFFARPTLEVARELVGKVIVDRRGPKSVAVRLTEVEAYIGEDDPASHAAPGPTQRNRLMYGPAGFAYVYLIYGMYHCLNVVTEDSGFPAAILIRGGEIVSRGTRKSGLGESGIRLDGPGRFCRGLGVDLTLNGLDLTGSQVYFEDRKMPPKVLAASPRIGISVGTDKYWRFFEPGASGVSKSRLESRMIDRRDAPAKSGK